MTVNCTSVIGKKEKWTDMGSCFGISTKFVTKAISEKEDFMGEVLNLTEEVRKLAMQTMMTA